MKHFISIRDLKTNEVISLIHKAIDSKNNSLLEKNIFTNKVLAMIFERPSTRTRLSFDIAARQLGGSTITLNYADIHLGSNKESISDTAKTISQYVDMIMLRSQSHLTMLELSKYSLVPVINGLSDLAHPCQALSDLMTIYEKKSKLENLNVSWVGPITNVTHSWIELMELDFGIKFSIFTTDFFLSEYKKKCAKYEYNINLQNINIFTTPEHLGDADIVITDTWESMGENINEEVLKDLKKYRVNSEMMSLFNKDCVFMHCLPANRDQEVSESVIDGSQSVIWDEALNRLHVQKEIIKWCL
jgi:ornithine carbamoyltransferase